VPDGAITFEGPRGGTYYVPGTEDVDSDELADAIRDAAEGTPAEDPANLVASASDDVDEMMEAVQEMPEDLQEEIFSNLGATEEDVEGDADEESQTEDLGENLTEDEISNTITGVADDLLEKDSVNSVEEINDGYCLYVAETVANEVEGDVQLMEHGTMGEFSHHFVEHDGQYYDAEAPDGVDDWQDLPFFDRTEMPSDEPDEVGTTKLGLDTKAGFETELYEVIGGDDMDGQLIGVAVDMPNDDVYVDWKNDAWPEGEQLDDTHVSIYGSIDDLVQATGNEVNQVETVELESSDTKADSDDPAEPGEESVDTTESDDTTESVRIKGLSDEALESIERKYNVEVEDGS
jgi:hypothetical protein